MSQRISTALAAVALALAASASQAAVYRALDAQSNIRVSATQMGVAVPATLKPLKGNVSFDPAAVAHAKLDVSVATAAIDSGSSDNDALLRGAEWLDAKAFPQAAFAATSFTPAGANRWWVSGKFTLKGQTQPLKVLATATVSGAQLALDADFNLDRKAWKLGTGDWADPGVVAPNIAVHVHLVLDPH